jgi:hypothetical protein
MIQDPHGGSVNYQFEPLLASHGWLMETCTYLFAVASDAQQRVPTVADKVTGT